LGNENKGNKMNLTPVGRLVQGSAWDPITTDMTGSPLTYKTGSKAGQPRKKYILSLAIEKTDPGVTALIEHIQSVAREAFPQLFDANGQYLKHDFAWKYVDGDSTTPNSSGVAPCNKEGFPGCWVFTFGSDFAPTVYETGGVGIITDPERFRRGDYCRINYSVKGNGQKTINQGVFLNYSTPVSVEFFGRGEQIVSGPKPDEVFGQAPTYVPAGVGATPQAPAPVTPAPAPVTPAPAPRTGYPGSRTGYPGSRTGYPGSRTGYPGSRTGYPGSRTGNGLFKS
jgi:hypothetical protein